MSRVSGDDENKKKERIWVRVLLSGKGNYLRFDCSALMRFDVIVVKP